MFEFETFPPASRYHRVGTKIWRSGQGKAIAYLKRRFPPQPEALQQIGEHQVSEGDRLDNITAGHLGDPQQFWQVCDANNVMHPRETEAEIGRKLRITAPLGVPGGVNA